MSSVNDAKLQEIRQRLEAYRDNERTAEYDDASVRTRFRDKAPADIQWLLAEVDRLHGLLDQVETGLFKIAGKVIGLKGVQP